jgi:osmotically-inducible protein OsmY
MQKIIISALVVGLGFSLIGCQSQRSASNGNLASLFSPFPSSTTLAQSVQDALVQSGDPVIAQVHVETNQKVVVLSGYVKKIRQSDTAEMIASKVAGVQQVQNNIIVRQ